MKAVRKCVHAAIEQGLDWRMEEGPLSINGSVQQFGWSGVARVFRFDPWNEPDVGSYPFISLGDASESIRVFADAGVPLYEVETTFPINLAIMHDDPEVMDEAIEAFYDSFVYFWEHETHKSFIIQTAEPREIEAPGFGNTIYNLNPWITKGDVYYDRDEHGRWVRQAVCLWTGYHIRNSAQGDRIYFQEP